MNRFLQLGVSIGLIISQNAWSSINLECMIKNEGDKLESLPVNNQNVIEQKKLPNQTLRRGHIQGTLLEIYPSTKRHDHLKVLIGPDEKTDTVEVVYNNDYGRLPKLYRGMSVRACGEAVTSTAPSGKYRTSSLDQMIFHWVHQDKKKQKLGGFLILEEKGVYGQRKNGYSNKRKVK